MRLDPIARPHLCLASCILGVIASISVLGRADEQESGPEPVPANGEAVAVELPPGYEEAPEANAAAPALPAAGKLVPAAPAPADLDAVVDDNVLQIEKNLLPQWQQIMNAELAFIHRVCLPTKEQHQALVDSGARSLKKTVRQFAIMQNQRMRNNQPGGIVIEQRNGQVIAIRSNTNDPRKELEVVLKQSIQEHLRPEQVKRYQQEIARRAEHVKHVTILNLVALIDQNLYLSPEQRDQMINLLHGNWQEHWPQTVEVLQHNSQYLPQIPDNCIVPVLNDTQKQVWNTTRKQAVQVMPLGFGIDQPMRIFDGNVQVAEPFIELE